jgi:hypothetical protein
MKHQLALAKEIQQQRYPDALVVFFAGSFVRGEATAYSDLDLVVVYESLPHAYRESFTYQSTPVEAFVHDPETLEYFFENVDAPSGIPSLMQMVIEGIELPKCSEVSTRLKALAQRYMALGPHPLSQEQIDRQRYAITDMLDDIREPRSYHELIATGAKLFETLADHHCRINGRWSGSKKSVPRVLRKHDETFYQLFMDSFENLFREGEPDLVITLAETVLQQSGGLLFEGYKQNAPESWRKITPFQEH